MYSNIETVIGHIRSTARLYGIVRSTGYKEDDTTYTIKVVIDKATQTQTTADKDEEGYVTC